MTDHMETPGAVASAHGGNGSDGLHNRAYTIAESVAIWAEAAAEIHDLTEAEQAELERITVGNLLRSIEAFGPPSVTDERDRKAAIETWNKSRAAFWKECPGEPLRDYVVAEHPLFWEICTTMFTAAAGAFSADEIRAMAGKCFTFSEPSILRENWARNGWAAAAMGKPDLANYYNTIAVGCEVLALRLRVLEGVPDE